MESSRLDAADVRATSTESRALICRRLSLLLYALAILMASVSLLFSQLDSGTYGLFHGLSPAYFVGLALLTISFLLAVRYAIAGRLFLFAQLLTFTVLLYFVAAFMEGTARFPYVYNVYGYTDFILQNGAIDTLYTYQCWPAQQILGAASVLVADINPTSLLLGYPMFILLITMPVVYLVLANLLEDRRLVWIGLWLYTVAGWVNQAYYTSHSYGYFMLLMIVLVMLAVVFRKMREPDRPMLSMAFALLVLVGAIVIGHLLSSLIALACLACVYLLLRVKRMPSYGLALPILLAAIIALWLYNPTGYLSDYRLNSSEEPPPGQTSPQPSTPSQLWEESASSAFRLGSEHANVMRAKLAYTSLYSALALAGLIVMLWRQRFSLRALLIGALILGILSSLIVGSYSGEIMSRVYGYALPFLSALAVWNLRHRWMAPVLIGFMLVAPTLFVVSAYGNEKFDYVSAAEIRGVEHFGDHTQGGVHIHSLLERAWLMEDIETRRWKPLSVEAAESPIGTEEETSYLLLGERDMTGMTFLYGDPGLEKLEDVRTSSYYGQVYSSQDFDLFMRMNNG